MVLEFKKAVALFKDYARVLYDKLIKPNSSDEDTARIEFILNVILLASIFLVAAAFLSVVNSFITKGDLYKGDPPFYIASILLSFIGLLVLSRKGLSKFASYVVIALYFLPIAYGAYHFGVDRPQPLLLFAFIIVTAGVLLGTRFAFIITSVVTMVILVFGFLQTKGIHVMNLYWKKEGLRIDEVFIFAVTFVVIAVVSWLSNREIEKSLRRARGAEKELRKERDSLEIKVKERTEELEHAQFEKTKQMQNFVEFGRNASGLFHDMVNPVQASLLSLEQLKNAVSASGRSDLKEYADEATDQMEKARKFISTARNQIARQEINIKFDPEEQIALVFQMLSFRAKREKVALSYSPHPTPLLLTGNPLSFHRLLAGLVSNAIDAYDGVVSKNENLRAVIVSSEKDGNSLNFSICDNGKGISEENQKKIFELFFTTKGIEKGTGVGLALCKEIVEKEFGGALDFESNEGVGSIFTIKLPFKR